MPIGTLREALNFQGSAAGIHLVVMGEIGEAFEDAEQFHAPGPAQDLHIARPARRAEWPQPRKGCRHAAGLAKR